MKESKNVLEEVEYLCFLCTSQRCGKIHILNTSTQMKAGEIVSSRETLPPISDSWRLPGIEKSGAAEFRTRLLLHSRSNPTRLRECHANR
jgi:hypothetical protein